MKVAVINFSGNVGKTTVARHMLLPRIPGAEFIAVETLNAGAEHGQALRGSEFRELQTYLQTIDNVVVDIGASNIEEFMARMHYYQDSHEDFDCFVVPTVSALKQQQDTIATIAELSQLGIPPGRLRVVFNMVERGAVMEKTFAPLLAFLDKQPLAHANVRSRIGMNELYERIKGSGQEVADVTSDTTNYKAKIAKAQSLPEKMALADRLANRRLAACVIRELYACFAALWQVGTTNAAPSTQIEVTT
jgi:hypothetical protein